MSDNKLPETIDRLAKVIARAGLCSRRDAEGWITAGRVVVNGKKVVTPAFNVTDKDKIEVDGLPLAARQGTRIWMYHKPAGLVVTERDPEGRPTIFEEFEKKGLPRVLTVGRLDINTEGLLLLTNDGGLKRVLELPSTGWLRRYRVRAHGSVTQAQLDALKDGITVEGIQYGPIQATLEREQGANVWIVLGLREGKNREVKNVLGSLGLEVNRLIRVSYGPFQLGDLPENGVEMVKARMLRDQLGKKLAEFAGVDFESEMPDAFVPPPRDDRPVRSPRDRDHSRPNPPRGTTPNREEAPRAGRPRRIHFEDDGRAPETFTPKPPPRGRVDKDDQSARSFGKPADRAPRDDRGAGKKPYGDRPPRDDRSEGRKSYGDRPQRDTRSDDRKPYGDRPSRPDAGRPAGRDGGDRPGRNGFNERPKRFGDKPAGKSFGDRPQRAFGDKPARADRVLNAALAISQPVAASAIGPSAILATVPPVQALAIVHSVAHAPKAASTIVPSAILVTVPSALSVTSHSAARVPTSPMATVRPAAIVQPVIVPTADRLVASQAASPLPENPAAPAPLAAVLAPAARVPQAVVPPAAVPRPTGGRPTGGRPSAGRPSSGPRKPRG